MSLSQRANASANACSLIVKQAAWKNARSILFYAPMPGEVDLWPLLQEFMAAGKTVALPRFDSNKNSYLACRIQDPEADIKTGQFGIREPNDQCAIVSPGELDLILVPGMAFDLRGRRLGRGMGFYDRMLAHASSLTCGIAFEEQIFSDIPVEPHDVRLNFVLTPTRWIEAMG